MERNNIIEKKAVRRPRRVLEYWRGLILNLKINMNFGTARNYRNSLYRFSEFLDRHDIAFSKIDADLVSDYELWLRKRGLKMNSVSFYLRCLRSVCNQAVSEGIARRIVPFQKVFTGVCATRKLAVPEAVFSKLLRWQLRPSMSRWHCRATSFCSAIARVEWRLSTLLFCGATTSVATGSATCAARRGNGSPCALSRRWLP